MKWEIERNDSLKKLGKPINIKISISINFLTLYLLYKNMNSLYLYHVIECSMFQKVKA